MGDNSNSSEKRGRHLKTAPENERPEKKKKHVGRTVIIVIAAVILVILLAVFLIFRDLYSQMNTKPHTTPGPTAVPAAVTDATPEVTATPEPTPRPLTEEETAELEEMELRSSLAESAEDVMSDSNVYNILLIGSDGRTEGLERSDAMIIRSVNNTTKTMWLTSLMRDTQVEIADWGIGHLNWATRFGGVDMLINTIESTRNFASNVDNWAMVDFLDFAKIASMVGPITVSVTKEEAADMNLLIREACQLNDAYYGTDVPRCRSGRHLHHQRRLPDPRLLPRAPHRRRYRPQPEAARRAHADVGQCEEDEPHRAVRARQGDHVHHQYRPHHGAVRFSAAAGA